MGPAHAWVVAQRAVGRPGARMGWDELPSVSNRNAPRASDRHPCAPPCTRCGTRSAALRRGAERRKAARRNGARARLHKLVVDDGDSRAVGRDRHRVRRLVVVPCHLDDREALVPAPQRELAVLPDRDRVPGRPRAVVAVDLAPGHRAEPLAVRRGGPERLRAGGAKIIFGHPGSVFERFVSQSCLHWNGGSLACGGECTAAA
jgi:hypothetical protein